MKFENKGKWMSQILESAELDSPENEEMALDMSEDEDIETQDEIEKEDEKDIEEISEEEEDTDDLIEDDLDLVEDEEAIDESTQKNEAMPPIGQRKRIEFEDDIVKVYDGNKEIYAGAEDYEPMQDEDWKWDNTNKYYKFDKYVKVCCESSQKNESKVNMSKLKNEIQAAVNKYFKDDKDLLEYVYIDTKKDKLGRDILEVRAELGYNNMIKLADYLDKIVTKYDKYAYFDQETSGIMTAVFESAQMNEDVVIVTMPNALYMQEKHGLTDKDMAVRYKTTVNNWKKAKLAYFEQTIGPSMKFMFNFKTMRLESA